MFRAKSEVTWPQLRGQKGFELKPFSGCWMRGNKGLKDETGSMDLATEICTLFSILPICLFRCRPLWFVLPIVTHRHQTILATVCEWAHLLMSGFVRLLLPVCLPLFLRPSLQGDAGQDGSVWFRAVSQTRIGSIYSPRLHRASLTPSLSVFFFSLSLIHWSRFWRSSFNPVFPSDDDTSITSCDPHLL